MRKWARVRTVILTLLPLSFAFNARADDAPWLQVERDAGAEHCPERAVLAASVEKARGGPLEALPNALTVQFRSQDGGLTAVISYVASDGRIVEARRIADTDLSCAPLAEAVAISVSVLADGLAERGAVAMADADDLSELPSKPKVLQPLALHLGGGMTFWITSAATLVGDFQLSVRPTKWIETRAGFFYSAPEPGRSVPFRTDRLSAGMLGMCVPVRSERAIASFCGLGLLGQWTHLERRAENNEKYLWGGVGIGAELSTPVAGWFGWWMRLAWIAPFVGGEGREAASGGGALLTTGLLIEPSLR